MTWDDIYSVVVTAQSGYITRPALLAYACSRMTPAEAHKVVDRAWSAASRHRDRLETEGLSGVHDRLAMAFLELSDHGILAEECFGRSALDGQAELGLKAELGGRDGYVFFPEDEALSVVAQAGVSLYFDSVKPAVSASEIACHIIATLEDHGLNPLWDGDVATPIFVPLTNWDHPLPDGM